MSDENLDIINEVTNWWKTCSIKDTSHEPDIWFNKPYYLYLKFRKIKETYEKYEDEMKSHVFDILP